MCSYMAQNRESTNRLEKPQSQLIFNKDIKVLQQGMNFFNKWQKKKKRMVGNEGKVRLDKEKKEPGRLFLAICKNTL